MVFRRDATLVLAHPGRTGLCLTHADTRQLCSDTQPRRTLLLIPPSLRSLPNFLAPDHNLRQWRRSSKIERLEKVIQELCKSSITNKPKPLLDHSATRQ